ncbi:hypothetical protein [Escherichia coli]|uniref:hypothetical protein n=1 Tax=Escherichia coli TaxID=562 RepID=UPI000246EA98|nr:hypothetical protein [Escherichia coli]EHN94254.1 hypothetical protein ESOG_04681 [Escherichia coli E101]
MFGVKNINPIIYCLFFLLLTYSSYSNSQLSNASGGWDRTMDVKLEAPLHFNHWVDAWYENKIAAFWGIRPIGEKCRNSDFCTYTGIKRAAGQNLKYKTKIVFYKQTVQVSDTAGRRYNLEMSFGGFSAFSYNITNFNSQYSYPGVRHELYDITAHVPKEPLSGSVFEVNDPFNNDWRGYTNPGGLSDSHDQIMLSLQTVSGGKLWVKYPLNLVGLELKIPPTRLMSMQVLGSAENNAYPSPQVNFYFSGTIKLPLRCYLSLSTNELKFSAVKTSDLNKSDPIDTKTIQVISNCAFAVKDSKLSIGVYPKNSNNIVDNNKLIAATTSDGKMALGFVFDVNNNPKCDGSSNFNSMRLIRNEAPWDVKSDNINIGLCKYGIPNTIGEHSATINIKAVWEKTH